MVFLPIDTLKFLNIKALCNPRSLYRLTPIAFIIGLGLTLVASPSTANMAYRTTNDSRFGYAAAVNAIITNLSFLTTALSTPLINWYKTTCDRRYRQIERYFVCKNQLQYLEKPLKF